MLRSANGQEVTMTTQHTPGPWEVSSRGLISQAEGSAYVAELHRNKYCESNPADYRLIAASPELLGALESVLETLANVARPGTPIELLDSVIAARAAIAKAKGE